MKKVDDATMIWAMIKKEQAYFKGIIKQKSGIHDIFSLMFLWFYWVILSNF